jgi:hypothetical protein
MFKERSKDLPAELQGLSKLHPQYDRMELEQAHSNLLRHFDAAWRMFLRLEQERQVRRSNLTDECVNHTVNSPKVDMSNPPSSKN